MLRDQRMNQRRLISKLREISALFAILFSGCHESYPREPELATPSMGPSHQPNSSLQSDTVAPKKDDSLIDGHYKLIRSYCADHSDFRTLQTFNQSLRDGSLHVSLTILGNQESLESTFQLANAKGAKAIASYTITSHLEIAESSQRLIKGRERQDHVNLKQCDDVNFRKRFEEIIEAGARITAEAESSEINASEKSTREIRLESDDSLVVTDHLSPERVHFLATRGAAQDVCNNHQPPICLFKKLVQTNP